LTEHFSLLPGAATFSCSPRGIQVRASVGRSARSASSCPYRSACPARSNSQSQATASLLAGSTTSWRTGGKAGGGREEGKWGGISAAALMIASTPSVLGGSLAPPPPSGAVSRWDGGRHSRGSLARGGRWLRLRRRRSARLDAAPAEVRSRWVASPHTLRVPVASLRPAPSASRG